MSKVLIINWEDPGTWKVVTEKEAGVDQDLLEAVEQNNQDLIRATPAGFERALVEGAEEGEEEEVLYVITGWESVV